MLTRIEFNDKIKACIIHFAENMCDSETRDVLNALKESKQIARYDKFIAVIPDQFTACEAFRLEVHRLIVLMRKQNPRFKIAVVTKLLTVIGYERFAKLVTQMVEKQEIFDTMDKAIAWIEN
ncbi:MAG: hypothetical protein GYA24_12875 [Candidatus Lokiarchaeota archaeon]|nr:hypothetical protein [Candidatus Lokiarchaeota archaeon]